MWVSLFLSYLPLRCLLSLGFVVVVASLGVWSCIFAARGLSPCFMGYFFVRLMGITGSHSEIGGCDRNGKCACYPVIRKQLEQTLTIENMQVRKGLQIYGKNK